MRRLGLNVCGHPRQIREIGKGLQEAIKNYISTVCNYLKKQEIKSLLRSNEGAVQLTLKRALRQKNVQQGTLLLWCRNKIRQHCLQNDLSNQSIKQDKMVVHGHIRVNGNKVDIPSHNAVKLEMKSL